MELYKDILECFRKKMEAEKTKFEYINPHFMNAIIKVIDDYYDIADEEDDIYDWIKEMFGA